MCKISVKLPRLYLFKERGEIFCRLYEVPHPITITPRQTSGHFLSSHLWAEVGEGRKWDFIGNQVLKGQPQEDDVSPVVFVWRQEPAGWGADDCGGARGVQILPTVCPVLLSHELQSNIQNIPNRIFCINVEKQHVVCLHIIYVKG